MAQAAAGLAYLQSPRRKVTTEPTILVNDRTLRSSKNKTLLPGLEPSTKKKVVLPAPVPFFPPPTFHQPKHPETLETLPEEGNQNYLHLLPETNLESEDQLLSVEDLPNPNSEHSTTTASDSSSDSEESDNSLQTDQNIIMACKSSLTPEAFHGKADEDALSFIDKFQCYVTFNGLNEDKQKASFPLLLRDSAFTWYMALPDATKNGEMKDLLEEFKKRFGPESLLEWAHVTDIFSKKQTKSEKVQDYITTMQRHANIAKLPDKQTVQAIISGLLPPIRQYVVQNNPETMADLLKHAKIGEASQGLQDQEADTKSTAVLTAIADLQKQVKDLSLQQEVATSAVAAMAQQPQRSRSPYRSGDGRRVRFENTPQTHYRSTSRDRYKNSAPTYGKTPGRQNYNNGFNCTACGSNRHSKQKCYYRNQTCNYCHKVGHIYRACFQAKKANI